MSISTPTASVSILFPGRLSRCSAFIILTVLFVFLSSISKAQKPVPKNLQKYDQQWIHFGFLLGINSADFNVKHVAGFNMLDSAYTLQPSAGAGFHLGIISNLRLGEHFDLRFTPSLSFCQRDLVYTFVNKDTVQSSVIKNVESTYLEFPLTLKFKSSRIKNYRVYVIGGIKYSLDMSSQYKVKDIGQKQFVKVYKDNYCFEYGLGIDCYMELFKFSPEIKLSHSINDLMVHDISIFSRSIDRIFSQIFYVTISFE